MLRARKILAYIVDKLELVEPNASGIVDRSSSTGKSFPESENDNKESEEHKKISLKPETWLE